MNYINSEHRGNFDEPISPIVALMSLSGYISGSILPKISVLKHKVGLENVKCRKGKKQSQRGSKNIMVIFGAMEGRSVQGTRQVLDPMVVVFLVVISMYHELR